MGGDRNGGTGMVVRDDGGSSSWYGKEKEREKKRKGGGEEKKKGKGGARSLDSACPLGAPRRWYQVGPVCPGECVAAIRVLSSAGALDAA